MGLREKNKKVQKYLFSEIGNSGNTGNSGNSGNSWDLKKKIKKFENIYFQKSVIVVIRRGNNGGA